MQSIKDYLLDFVLRTLGPCTTAEGGEYNWSYHDEHIRSVIATSLLIAVDRFWVLYKIYSFKITLVEFMAVSTLCCMFLLSPEFAWPELYFSHKWGMMLQSPTTYPLTLKHVQWSLRLSGEIHNLRLCFVESRKFYCDYSSELIMKMRASGFNQHWGRSNLTFPVVY